MLHDILIQYLADVESAVQGLDNVYIERYEEEILASDRVNLRIRIRFAEGYLLELNEAVKIEAQRVRHLGYRYHLQNRENNLVFRYDNTPHYPNLDSSPHHKHLSVRVIPSDKPSIPSVILEAVQNIVVD